MDDSTDLKRWACTRHDPAVLLGMITPGGHVEIRVADRFYRVSGVVVAVCPVCGHLHRLDVTRPGDRLDGRS